MKEPLVIRGPNPHITRALGLDPEQHMVLSVRYDDVGIIEVDLIATTDLLRALTTALVQHAEADR